MKNASSILFLLILLTLPTLNVIEPVRASSEQLDRFKFVTVSLYVKDVYGNPISNAEVKAFSEEWGIKYPKYGFQRTDNNGLTEFQLPVGIWAFFASRSLEQGYGLFVVLKHARIDRDSTFTMQANGEIKVTVRDINNQPLDVQIRMMDSEYVPIVLTSICGNTNNGKVSLYVTDGITYDILLFSLQNPGYILWQRNISSGQDILVRPTTTRLTFSIYDKNNNPTTGTIWVNYHDFDVGETTGLAPVEFPTEGNRIIYLTPGKIGIKVILTTGGWCYSYEYRDYIITEGTTLDIKYGGQLSAAVRVLLENTQIWLEVKDQFGNLMVSFADRNGDVHIPIKLGKDGQIIYSGDLAIVDGEYQPWLALISAKLGQTYDSQTRYEITLNLGDFGLFQLTGTLSGSLLQYVELTSSHFIMRAPQGFTSKFNEMLQLFESAYEAQSTGIQEYLTDKITVTFYINPGSAGFAGNNLIGMGIGFSLDTSHKAVPSHFIGVAFHELGHVFELSPPFDWDRYEGWFGEPFATLLGYYSIEQHFGTRLALHERGDHDGFFEYLKGKKDVDLIERMQFVLFYLKHEYGMEIHRGFAHLWADNSRKYQKHLLIQKGFTTEEAIAVLYSYLSGENLAWIFNLAGLNVAEERISTGLEIITNITNPTLDLKADKPSYARGEVVTLTASVVYNGNALSDVEVVFEVRNPVGGVMATGSATTDNNGVARKTFTLPGDADLGRYSAYASISYQGLTASNRTEFSVIEGGFHVSLTLHSTDPEGNPKSSFRRGESPSVKLVVKSDGGSDITKAHILITFYDSNNVPVSFSFDIVDLGIGEERTSIKGFTLSPSAATGTYRVEVIVLTDFIANGGVYIPDGNGSIDFQVTT
jgi:hypothetical protein